MIIKIIIIIIIIRIKITSQYLFDLIMREVARLKL
jgi:hypothetical protein